mgnify:CR=1 FL=1
MDDKVGESGKKWSILTKGPRRPDMLFRGQSYRSLDAKGRLMLPPEFRDALTAASADGTFVLTTYDGCLVGYPSPLWNELLVVSGTVRGKSGTFAVWCSAARRINPLTRKAGYAFPARMWNMPGSNTTPSWSDRATSLKYGIRPGSRLCSHRILTMWPMNWLKAASTSLFKNPRTRCL